jgi:hypothetical protein
MNEHMDAEDGLSLDAVKDDEQLTQTNPWKTQSQAKAYIIRFASAMIDTVIM